MDSGRRHPGHNDPVPTEPYPPPRRRRAPAAGGPGGNPLTAGQRLRAVVNWVNLSTPLGLLVAALGGARPVRVAAGLRLAEGYRLPLMVAPAFTIGNVVLARVGARPPTEQEMAHEARHATQYALLGPLFLPLYGLCAGWSWATTGGWGSHNPFEHWAGFADGNYVRLPLRPWLERTLSVLRLRRRR